MRALTALLCLVLVVGCQTDPATPGTGLTPSAAPSPTTASASPATPTSNSSSSAAVQYFRTPSGNVTCRMAPQQVECTPKEHDWGVYSSADFGVCAQSPAVLVRVTATVEVGLDCAGVVSRGAKVLGYEDRVELGQVRCVSERAALSCARTDTGVGFTLSRAAIDTNATAAARGDAPRPPMSRTLPADTEITGFVTPTGDILCDIYEATLVTCFVWGHTWKAPPYDSERDGPCDADHAVEVHLDDKGPGATSTTCRSDSLGAGPVLGYGHSLLIGALRCSSAKTGITCRNASTGHGFEASMSRFRGY